MPRRRRRSGLVWGTVADALHRFKGAPGTDTPGRKAPALAEDTLPDREPAAATGLPFVCLSRPLAEAIAARPGDLVYITDSRWWLGGLYSAHATVDKVVESSDDQAQARVQMAPSTFATVVTRRRREKPVVVERLY